VAQRLVVPNSGQAKWVRKARIVSGDFSPTTQSELTSEERGELDQLREENQELWRKKDYQRPAAAHLEKGQLPPRDVG
jgi:hypothetical protein